MALDHFRFFLNNLWFPWDEDEDESDSLNHWFQEHLKNRVIFNQMDYLWIENIPGPSV